MIVHFQPEAWFRDHAIPVDDEGPDTWAVTGRTEARIRSALDGGSDLDFVREDDHTPAWVRAWTGPFTITVEQP